MKEWDSIPNWSKWAIEKHIAILGQMIEVFETFKESGK